MLHVGVLPHHRNWGDFFANLDYVVVDEAHVYRGVFGSHVANVLRRLRRVAAPTAPSRASSSPRRRSPTRSSWPSASSAPPSTSSTPTAPRSAGADRDLEPAADRPGPGARRSALSEAADMLTDLLLAGMRTICFVGSRRGAELIQQFTRRSRWTSAAARPRRARSPPTGPATRRSSGARSRRG